MMLTELNIDEIRTLDDALTVIKQLFARCAELEAENQRLKEQNQQLKEQIARLSKNSRNSSKPPSSDIVKPPEERKQARKRRIGGQRGHLGFGREKLSQDQIDDTKELELKDCPDCGAELDSKREDEVRIDQVAELVERPVHVLEYRRFGHFCPRCQVVHFPKLPPGIIEGQCCGIRLQSFFVYLKGAFGASYTEIAQFSDEVLRLSLSRATICNIISRASNAFSASYDEVQEALATQESLNIDESGWRDRGKTHWVWLFCNSCLAFFYIAPSRGAAVLREILGATFDGRITSDFYSAYVCYASAFQQFCLAHLIRDIKYLTTLPDEVAKEFGEKLLQHFRLVFRLWHNRGIYSADEFSRRVSLFETRLRKFLFSQKFQRSPARTMQRRLIKHWESIFRFLHHPQLYEPTNNSAERTMRFLVRIRSHTQGSRSDWGQAWTSSILTILATCRKQNRSPWLFIHDSLFAFHANQPMPSLLPLQR